MLLDNADLFYQDIIRMGLKIHDVDGWQYGYDKKTDGLKYCKNTGTFRFTVIVELSAIKSQQDYKERFTIELNKAFSKAYAKHLSKRLASDKKGSGGYINNLTY